MEYEFKRERERAQVGQKSDSSPSMIASSIANVDIPFGSLVVFDDTDAFLCKLPSKGPIDKPLGIALRQLHCQKYEPKNSIAVMRKGRVWVESEKVNAPGDVVYMKFLEDGSTKFTGEKKDNFPVRGALFLDKTDGGLVPIEINFFGGVQ